MKGGKDDEKIMGPLFPRLHVNDTESGGPRAPPRNKMALYEQLSIPSQRVNSQQPLTLPLQHNKTNSLVLPASSSQGCHERSVLSPFHVTSTPAHSAERLHSRSSDRDLNTAATVSERKSMETSDYQTSNTKQLSLSTFGCDSFRANDLSHSKNSCGKKVGDEDDFMVPTFVNSGHIPLSRNIQQNIDRERLALSSLTHPGHSTVTPGGRNPMKTAAATCSSSLQPQISHDKLLKQTNPTDLLRKWTNPTGLKSIPHVRNPSEELENESLTGRGDAEKLASHQSTGHVSSNKEQQINHDSERLCGTDSQLHQEYRDGLFSGNTVHSGHILVHPMEGVVKGNAPRVRTDPCPRSSFERHLISRNEAENYNEYDEDQVPGSLLVGDADRNDDISEASMVDSISGLDISPDDVVEVIGQKHFWKARRAIVNQQRVFAVQVFELHRLIKVQKLIAESPYLMLDDNPYLRKPSLKVSPTKKPPYVLKSPSWNVKPNESQKLNQTECTAENTVKKSLLPSVNKDINKGLVHQKPSCAPYSGNPPPSPITTDNKAGPWSFHPPPGNQWLVPVMSPSEGLIYKPYTGPSPPTTGFMAPIYGGYGPFTLPSVPGDFLHPVYGVPAPHQQAPGVLPGPPPPGQTYFSPYGMPVINPVMSSSAVEQMSMLARAQFGHSEQLSIGDVNFNAQSEAISSCVPKFRTSKESEIHASIASSPSEKPKGARAGAGAGAGAGARARARQAADGRDALPLFPVDPVTEVSNQTPRAETGDHPTRVIKVVPHNPRSATKSAARIFRSIQEERLQHESR